MFFHVTCFHPTKRWMKQTGCLCEWEGRHACLGIPNWTLTLTSPTWRGQRSLATWDFYGQKSEGNGSLGWFETWIMFFGCCESGVDSDASFPQVNTWRGVMSFTHLVICSPYHPIPISNPQAAARIVAHPHSTWTVSQMCPVSPIQSRHPRKQPYVFGGFSRETFTHQFAHSINKRYDVLPLRSGTGVLMPHLFGTRRAISKILKEQVTKPILTIQIDFWEVYDPKLEKTLESCTFSQIPSVLFLNSLRNSDGTSEGIPGSSNLESLEPSPVSPAALSLSVCFNPSLEALKPRKMRWQQMLECFGQESVPPSTVEIELQQNWVYTFGQYEIEVCPTGVFNTINGSTSRGWW